MPASKKRPADFTGRLNEKLTVEKKEHLTEVAQRVAMVNEVIEEEKNTVVDYTNSDQPIPEAELRQAVLNTPFRTIRVNSDIPQMTYGREVVDPGDENNPDIALRRPPTSALKFYDFKEGQLARVPKELAEHLDRLGYVSYMGNG
jgi:hypothetical protein